MQVGDTYHDYTLVNAETGDASFGGTLNSTSYFEHVCSLALDDVPFNKNVPNQVVIGAAHTLREEPRNGGAWARLVEETSLNLPLGEKPIAEKSDFTQAAGTFPIDFDAVLAGLGTASAAFAGSDSGEGVQVHTMTVAEFNASGFTAQTNGGLLVLNLDATGLSAVDLGGGNGRLTVDGYAGAGWNDAAARVVVNLFTQAPDGSYAPFAGTVDGAGYVFGTLLAPAAQISSLRQDYNGTLAAKSVENAGGEIHAAVCGAVSAEATALFHNKPHHTPLVLPETGGIGTQPFTFLGLGLIFTAALAALAVRRLSFTAQSRGRLAMGKK